MQNTNTHTSMYNFNPFVYLPLVLSYMIKAIDILLDAKPVKPHPEIRLTTTAHSFFGYDSDISSDNEFDSLSSDPDDYCSSDDEPPLKNRY